MGTVRDRPGWTSFRERLRDTDRCVLGTWLKLPTLETVELLAAAGCEFVVIDLEHSPLTVESGYRASVVAQALGMHVLVRTPDRGGSHVQRLLDIGVDGLLVPRVSGAEEAQRVVDDMRFPPDGRRGMGSTSRAGLWGTLPAGEYLRRGREDIVRAIQLEDVEALEDLDAVLDTKGLDAVFLGTADLALSSGLAGDDPVLRGHVDRFLASARARGLPRGTAVGGPAAVADAAARGFTFLMVSNDASLFAGAARSVFGGVDARSGEPARGVDARSGEPARGVDARSGEPARGEARPT